jgi:hypothetical protein
MNDRRFELIVGLLVAVIVAGGIAVTFLGTLPSQGSAGAAAGADYGTILLPGKTAGLNALQGSIDGAGLNAAAVSTSTATMTQTMTVTSAATSYGSPRPSSSLSTVILQNNPSSAGSHRAAPQQTSTTGNSIEFFSNVTLRVPVPSLVLDKVSGVAYSLGGYVAYSFFTNSTALVVVRVPAQNYQHALSEIETLGTIAGAVTNSNDVTVQYTDLNATLLSLKGEQASLLKLLNQSSNINATLRVYSMVQQVNAKINEIQSENLQTKTLIDYGTIYVSLQKQSDTPPPPPTKPLSLKFTATPKSGLSPVSVTFNAIVKGGTAPYIVNYNFGDGTSARADALIHTFGQPGHYNVSVAATDSTGNVTESWTMVDVLNPPVTSSFGTFPAFVGGLFLSVVEGIAEVAVVVLPIAAVVAVTVIPLKRRFGAHQKENKESGASR